MLETPRKFKNPPNLTSPPPSKGSSCPS
jgi:hypothetical protein